MHPALISQLNILAHNAVTHATKTVIAPMVAWPAGVDLSWSGHNPLPAGFMAKAQNTIRSYWPAFMKCGVVGASLGTSGAGGGPVLVLRSHNPAWTRTCIPSGLVPIAVVGVSDTAPSHTGASYSAAQARESGLTEITGANMPFASAEDSGLWTIAAGVARRP